jgi:hypothetical protein
MRALLARALLARSSMILADSGSVGSRARNGRRMPAAIPSTAGCCHQGTEPGADPHPHPHPRFAGDRGSTPIPIPDLPGIGGPPPSRESTETGRMRDFPEACRGLVDDNDLNNDPRSGQVRSGQVRSSIFLGPWKSEAMRVTRQLGLRTSTSEVPTGLNLATTVLVDVTTLE